MKVITLTPRQRKLLARGVALLKDAPEGMDSLTENEVMDLHDLMDGGVLDGGYTHGPLAPLFMEGSK